MNVSQFYSALLFLFAIVLEALVHLTLKTQNEDKTIREKNKMFTHVPFISLSAMSGLVLLASSITDIINFRLAWIVKELNGKYEISFEPMIVTNEYYVLLDFLFILLIFYAMLKFSRSFKYRKYPYHQEGFYLDASRQTDILLMGFVYPSIYIFYMLGFFGIGISLLLVIFSLIPCSLISYVFWKNIRGENK